VLTAHQHFLDAETHCSSSNQSEADQLTPYFESSHHWISLACAWISLACAAPTVCSQLRRNMARNEKDQADLVLAAEVHARR